MTGITSRTPITPRSTTPSPYSTTKHHSLSFSKNNDHHDKERSFTTKPTSKGTGPSSTIPSDNEGHFSWEEQPLSTRRTLMRTTTSHLIL